MNVTCAQLIHSSNLQLLIRNSHRLVSPSFSMTPAAATSGPSAAAFRKSSRPMSPNDANPTANAGGGQWKQLTFFEKEEVLESSSIPADITTSLDTWLQNVHITSSTSGRGFLVFGDSQGIVHILNQAMVVIASFKAHSSPITHVKQMRRKPILLTIGEDDSATPTLKIWSIEKEAIESGKPAVLIQTKKITHKAKVFPVTAFAALENLNQIAIGLENGIVIVYRGDLSRARQSKTVVVHEGSETVTGLGFREDGSEGILYICTFARIIACVTSNRDTKNVLEEQGVDISLSLTTPGDRFQEMAMAREEAVYFYGPDGRGPCFLIDGKKTLMTWFRGYLVLVSKEAPLRTNVLTEFGNASDSAVATGSEAELSQSWSTGGPSPGHVLTIYDLKSKFIAYRGSFGTRRFDSSVGTAVGEPISHVLSEWGELFVITKGNKIFRLHETDLDSKLDLLYAKGMYNLAISMMTHPATAIHTVGLRSDFSGGAALLSGSEAPLAKPDEASTLVIMDIHKRYGDHLYSRGEFDSSVKQYIKTIGHLEPSYVIRKFLDAQRIYNLTSYLQALHDHQLANPNHTTLLLNCYTKLKDIPRLDSFISSPTSLFDVETAIRVCRQASYYTHALKLAARFGQHEWHMRVQIEDLQQYDEALAYLAKLPRKHQIRKALPSYGYILVKHRPCQATEALVRACTRPTVAKTPNVENKVSKATPADMVDSHTMSGSVSAEVAQVMPDSLLDDDIAQPQDFMSFFVDQPVWCITFIENVLWKRWGVNKDLFSSHGPTSNGVGHSVDVPSMPTDLPTDSDSNSRQILWDTLLELYLGQFGFECQNGSPSNQQKHNWPRRIMALLKSTHANYDVDQALVLCKTHGFNDGILFLLQRLKLYHDYLEFHMRRREDTLVLQTCQLFGDIEPSLWAKALVFFVEKGVQSHVETVSGDSPPDRSQRDLLLVLDQIQKRKLLSQLQIVQLLAKNSDVTLGMVRDFLIKRIEEDKASMDESRQLIASYQEDTAKMRLTIEELESGFILFQSTRCELCRQQLELPTVHFYCKHAFHHRCLGDADQECPKCAPEHRMVQELVRTQRINAKRHDTFVRKLAEGSEHEDKFSLIAEYFSKNIFSE